MQFQTLDELQGSISLLGVPLGIDFYSTDSIDDLVLLLLDGLSKCK
jgi:hypothetical protein